MFPLQCLQSPIEANEYVYVSPTIIADNVCAKAVFYECFLPKDGSLKIMIFAGNHIMCQTMWQNIFAYGVELVFPLKFDLIPLPQYYQPTNYDAFMSELKHHIGRLIASSRTWGVFNLGTRQTPLLNFVLADRKIRKNELAFEVPQNFPEAVALNDDAVGIGSAGAQGSSYYYGYSNSGSTQDFDLKMCKALGAGVPLGIPEYVRSMYRLRSVISSIIEEPQPLYGGQISGRRYYKI